ncbi:MAG TPA: hypothetical protein VGN72_04300 [Tepidisphaeraceae bacterium]|jgi:hypothetical protein|nr:hypothetical protein [Tepidisphaeraceae bacterium]
MEPRYKAVGYFTPREGGQYGSASSAAAGGVPSMKSLTLDLSVATTDKEYPISGNVLWYLDSTAAGDRLQVRFDDFGSDPLPWRPGISIVGRTYGRVYLSWAAQPGSIAVLAYTNDPAATELQVV